MKFFLLPILLLLFFDETASAYSKYWVTFTDKNGTPYNINNPSAFLSIRAIQRRQNQSIPVTVRDLPVDPVYVAQVLATGTVTLNFTSRWFNAVSITTTDTNALNAIGNLSFVVSVDPVKRFRQDENDVDKEDPVFPSEEKIYPTVPGMLAYNYGGSYNQANQIGAVCMHNLGYHGEGMVIAVIDDGFSTVDTHTGFDSVRTNNQILGTWDFVVGEQNVYNDGNHGTRVFSCIAGYIDGQLVGTAPKAAFWLLRTEDVNSEYLYEEDTWVAGAEFADSVGADIITSSLGYTVFDDGNGDHTYSDMDGNTNRVTIGADYAAATGMFVCICQGNSGSQAWYYMWAPADGDSVLSVGAVNSGGTIASFSSHGPTFDGRIKPNTCAQGVNATVVNPSGGVTQNSGTSFSTPITAGAVACLWQANPMFTNMQLFTAILQSADRYTNPDNDYGYGIPDFCNANIFLSELTKEDTAKDKFISVYPNPASDFVSFTFYSASGQELKVQLMDVTGKVISEKNIFVKAGLNEIRFEDLPFAPGVYLLRIQTTGNTFSHKLIRE